MLSIGRLSSNARVVGLARQFRVKLPPQPKATVVWKPLQAPLNAESDLSDRIVRRLRSLKPLQEGHFVLGDSFELAYLAILCKVSMAKAS